MTDPNVGAAVPTTKKKRWWRWPIRILGFLILVEISLQVPVYLFPGRLTPSAETTVYTSPLRTDGGVDYPAALDAEHSKGVTADNNAAIPLALALGPKQFLNDDQAKELGVVYQSDQKYFEPWATWAAREIRPSSTSKPSRPTLQDRMMAGMLGKPMPDDPPPEVADMTCQQLIATIYRGQNIPEVSRWLDEMAPHLLLATEASKRARYYVPLACPRGTWLLESGPKLGNVRGPAQALCVRSALRIFQNNIEEAWADAMAVRRLGSLVAQDGSLISQLMGLAIQSGQLTSAAHLALDGNLSRERALRFAQETKDIASVGDFASLWQHERLLSLEMVWRTEREVATSSTQEWHTGGVDFNEMARRANWWFDNFEGLRKDAAQYSDLERLPKSPTIVLRAGGFLTQGALSRQIVDSLIPTMIPTWGRSRYLLRDGCMRADMVHVAMLLAAYHAETGTYPEKLELLKERYGMTMPEDPNNHSPLIYRLTEQGYDFYGVGHNQKDDGGEGDDITIQALDKRS